MILGGMKVDVNKTYKGVALQEVLTLLQQHENTSKVIAGGTDLIIQLRECKVTPQVLIDVSSLEEIKGIEIIENRVSIGAATTFTQLVNSPFLNNGLEGLKEAAKSVGSPQIRNIATVGGNICNASPAADIIPPLLVLDSELYISDINKSRTISLEKFLIDKGQVDLKTNELLCHIQFNNIKNNQGLGFSKLGLRKSLAIARISVAVWVEVEENTYKQVRIATGACSKLGVREREVEALLLGKPVEEKTMQLGAEALKTQLEKRLAGRKGMEYKREAIQGVFKEALTKATYLSKT